MSADGVLRAVRAEKISEGKVLKSKLRPLLPAPKMMVQAAADSASSEAVGATEVTV